MGDSNCQVPSSCKKLTSDIANLRSEMFAAVGQPHQLTHHMMVACAGCGSAMHDRTHHQECLIKHMSQVTRLVILQKYVALCRPHNRLAVHSNNLVQGLSSCSHSNSVYNSTCNCIRHMKWQQNLYQQLCTIIIIHSTLCLDAIPDPRAYIWTAG